MTYPSSTKTEADAPQNLTTIFVHEAIVRYRGRQVAAERQISTPKMAVSIARKVVIDEAREHFTALYLNSRHRPIAHSVVSVGTDTASLVAARNKKQPFRHHRYVRF